MTLVLELDGPFTDRRLMPVPEFTARQTNYITASNPRARKFPNRLYEPWYVDAGIDEQSCDGPPAGQLSTMLAVDRDLGLV